jgi:hypothetical protein
VLAHLYGGSPLLPMRLQFDDRLYREHCRRLLEDHPGMVDVAGLHERPSHVRGEESEVVGALVRGLLAGVARAGDNELFAIVAAAPQEAKNVDRLMEAVRVARAAHHRVLMIDAGPELLSEQFVDAAARQTLTESQWQTESERFPDLQRRFTRLGAKIARLDDGRLMEHVAAEIDLLRSGRARASRGGT